MTTLRRARPSATPDLDPLLAAVAGVVVGLCLGGTWPHLYVMLSALLAG